MKTLIVFYSRTGTTATVAHALAETLDADIAEIKCPRYRPGWLRYLRAGYDSVKGNLPPIDIPPVPYSDYDLILLGAPIWTSYPALPLRSFLSESRELPARVALFLTYGGHSLPEKAVEAIAKSLPTALESTLEVRHDDVEQRGFSDTIKAFAGQLETGL